MHWIAGSLPFYLSWKKPCPLLKSKSKFRYFFPFPSGAHYAWKQRGNRCLLRSYAVAGSFRKLANCPVRWLTGSHKRLMRGRLARRVHFMRAGYSPVRDGEQSARTLSPQAQTEQLCSQVAACVLASRFVRGRSGAAKVWTRSLTTTGRGAMSTSPAAKPAVKPSSFAWLSTIWKTRSFSGGN